MKGFDILRVKSAVKSRNKFDLSRTHLTTAEFGQIIPLFAEETVPGDEFNVGANFFSRMAPLVKPTFGKFSFKTVNAFVPYHQLASDVEAWLAGKTTWEGQTPTTRWFTFGTLVSFLINVCGTSVGATALNADMIYVNTSGTDTYMIWTSAGKYYVKILNALGYSVPQRVDLQTGSNWRTNVSDLKLSALPLIAFFKLYNDYMSQSTRFNTSSLSDLLNRIKYKNAYSGMWNNTTGEINSSGINAMFSNLFLNYENDYFTSAWQSPNNAINHIESVNGIYDGTMLSPVSGTTTDNVTTLPVSGNSTALGQRVLDILRSFDNWVRRNNYSGSRAVQQVYSRMGIKTDEYRSHYANVISTETMPIQVGDITATADANTVLGSYAGKAIMNGSKGFSFKADDYGIILVLGYFTVAPMMSFGFERKVLRSAPLDYYNPEFDGVGLDAISLGEIYSNPIADNTDTTLDSGVFGFTERYNSYRYGRDVISGEFRNYHPDGVMNVWHTGRNLNAIRAAGTLVAQNRNVNTLPQTDSEYNRIFNVTGSGVDHFYLTCQFDVSAIRPMLNLNQVVNLGEGDTVVPRNGNVIS